MVEPGDIVQAGDTGRRTVVDVAVYEEGAYAVLRYCDDDPRRRVDPDGGDIFLEAEPVEPDRRDRRGLPPLLVVGRLP